MTKRRQLVWYSLVLGMLGAGWGITQPLTKITVSTGYQPWGLILWQLIIGAVFMAVISLLRGKGLPLTRGTLRISLVMAVIGTLVPNTASYTAIVHLPSGIMSILLSLIPMMAFPIALGLRLEPFRITRLAGLSLGLVGVLFLVIPEASLPDRAMLIWIPVALIAPVCYAFEGNYVAKWGTGGLDPIQVLFGASLIGSVLVLPMAIGSGQYISPFRSYGAAEFALVASSIIHVVVYASYVWLVGKAGPVFSMQVSYLVTGFGVFWAMVLLGESYSSYVWVAMGLMLAGVFLVQPRTSTELAPSNKGGQDKTQEFQQAGL
ncbi:DMT family transporter [Aliisedimentitalea scapharcae]|uniref:DMT family transporter n=1 Tax=Aliisedimentitalea scapharcae TaxID=1524259 RepID=A0ABZ2XWC4_9RHOB